MAVSKSTTTQQFADGPMAVLYARAASIPQVGGSSSISEQLKILHDYAYSNGLNVVKEFVDAGVASADEGSAFKQMVEFLRTNTSVSHLLVECACRVLRDSTEYASIGSLGCAVHFVRDGKVVSQFSKPHKKLIHSINLLMTKYYIDDLSERVRKGMTEKAEEGIWPSLAPIGYTNVLLPSGKRGIAPDEQSAESVRRLFKMYATGNYTLRQMAEWARESGVTFPKSGHPLNEASIFGILQNPIYAGTFVWAGKTYKGAHKPLISCKLWERVQSILARKFQKNG